MHHFTLDTCDKIQIDDTNYIVTWNEIPYNPPDKVKLRIEMTYAKIYGINYDTIVDINLPKYTKIKFYHYWFLTKVKKIGQKSSWKTINLKLDDNVYAVKLIDDPIYENHTKICRQKIQLSNNTIKEIVLFDTCEYNTLHMSKCFGNTPTNYHVQHVLSYAYNIKLVE